MSTNTILYFVHEEIMFIGYVKVFGHDTAGGLFSRREDALTKNKDNPDAQLFSILNQLENYRGSDGNFQFKLCYPELNKCNVWIQSSNPATETTIRGFEPISLAFKTNGIGAAWAGLGKSSSDSVLTDDAPAYGSWYSAIGAFTYWPGKPTIPGPRGENGITKVNLYVKTK